MKCVYRLRPCSALLPLRQLGQRPAQAALLVTRHDTATVPLLRHSLHCAGMCVCVHACMHACMQALNEGAHRQIAPHVVLHIRCRHPLFPHIPPSTACVEPALVARTHSQHYALTLSAAGHRRLPARSQASSETPSSLRRSGPPGWQTCGGVLSVLSKQNCTSLLVSVLKAESPSLQN